MSLYNKDMVEMKKVKKALFAKIYALIAIIFIFAGLIIIRLFEPSAEFWTRTYYRFLQSTFGPLVSWIPFSIAEVFFILFALTIIVLLVFIFADFAKRKGLEGLNKSLALLLVVVSTFAYYFSTAGVGYGRYPVDIPQHQENVESSEYVPIVEHFLTDFNAVADTLDFDDNGSVIKPYTISELNIILQNEFEGLESDYFTRFTPNVKPMFLSFLFREFNITGISFAPTTEPNINYLTPDSQLVSTMAHEIAHSKGAMREQDANLVAAYILLNSEEPYLRYSGYYTTFYSIISLANFVGDDQKYSELYNSLRPEIKNDYKYSREYWAEHDFLDDMATWFNNLYLSIVGNEGVSSYVDNPDIDETTDPDTGETIQYIKEFSPFQKLYFYFYYE